jgi:tetratricopeptide (TPR) repeat protein
VEDVQELLQSARALQAAGDTDGAMGIYEEILGQKPDNAGTLRALGVLLNGRRDFARAATLLERATVLHPTEPTWHVDLGESYRNLSMYQEAIGSCLMALRLRPEYPEGLNTLGLALRGTGDIKGALEQFLRAIGCQDDFSPGHINAGLAFQELGALDEAISHFRRAGNCPPILTSSGPPSDSLC